MGSNDNIISAEVDSRLDDFFGEGGSAPAPKPVKSTEESRQAKGAEKMKKQETTSGTKPNVNAGHSMLNELKSIVLSLEWEITDQVMQRLGEEISRLETAYKDDKIVVAFLQLLGSLRKYIQKKMADAHPDSISLINSVYENLEQVMLSSDMTEAAKKKILVIEVNKYKELKDSIKTTPVKKERHLEPAPPAVEDHPPAPTLSIEQNINTDMGHMGQAAPVNLSTSPNDIVLILEKINETIKAEFKALREEVKNLREK